MNSPRSFRATTLWLAILLFTAAAATTVSAYTYTPPSPPDKRWDYLNDNFFSLANRTTGSTGSLIVTSTGATQATSTSGNTAYQQQYMVLLNLDDWTYRIINRESGLCVAPLNGGTTVGTPLAAVAYTGATNQRWFLTGTGGGYWAFVHANTGLAMQTNGANPAAVTLQAVNTALTQQQWLADPGAPVDHYPKKGYCGWDGWAYRFNISWFYNWADTTTAYLQSNVAFNGMKHDPGWPGINTLGGGYNALHATARPVTVLAYNEPDHTDQANATTDNQIAIWPDLQNLNVPLGSPSAASTWGGWMSDFYNKIAAKGYRVDYTAIHNYPTDPWNLDSYLNNVNSVNNTWGRPVWITEFALTGWGGNVTWTEENCWTWLAEFMWRAEDYPNLRRYSYFSYPSTPPANPWNAYGTNSAGLLTNDGSAMTNLGELYASWDADRTVKDRTAYMLQGKQSMMRLSTSTANSLFPAGAPAYPSPVSIRVSGAQAQWALVTSPTSGQYYLTSLLDGRRLQTDGTGVSLAAPGTTGTTVQWSIAVSGNGYFFINNPAKSVTLYSHRDNNSSGVPTSVYYGVVASGSPTDYTRFRLVKPLSAATVPTAAPATPGNVTVTPGDRRNVVRWTGTGSYYTIARSTSASGPFTTLVTNWPTASYVDNTATNGTTYYYTVTASNLLADTSSASAGVAGLPAANLAVPDLEAVYKFEGSNAQDNSGNVEAGAVKGDAVFFTPGKIDGSALNFNGTNTNVLLPAVVANDFSLAFWMRTTATGGTGTQWWSGSGLVDAEVSGAAADYGISLLGTKVAFGVGNPDTTIVSTSTVNDGAWHHVVATRNGATGAMLLYVDGALQSSVTGPTGTRTVPTGISLGSSLPGSNFYKGDLDEVRLYSYVLGTGDIGKLAGGAINALVAQYTFADSTVQDTSGQGNQGAANAVAYSTPGKTDAAAASFNGTSSYALLPESLTNDFTISYWLKTTSAGFTGTQWWQGAGLIDAEMSGAMNDFGTSLLGGKLAFGVGNTDYTIVSNIAVNDGAWHHVAATRNGTNGTMRIYIDGMLTANGVGPIGARTAPTALSMGRLLPGYNYYQGLLDDVRLYNYALSTGQIQSFTYPVPAPWSAQDVGNPIAPGFASFYPNANGGTWTVGGSGADIWGASDQFGFMSTPQSSAGTLITRITSLPINPDGTTTANAKAGLMWRDGTAANAAYVDLVHDLGQGVQFIARSAAGGASVQSFANVTGLTAPYWLKLTRGGADTFQGYYSSKVGIVPPTAAEWTLIGTYNVAMNSGNVLAGLAVTSHANGTLASANFDSFNLLPNSPPTLSTVANQTLVENSGAVTLGVNLADAESPATVLSLSVTSSNQGVLPLGNMILGGAGTARTVQFTPAANQAGVSTVILSANDGQATSTTSFTVTVTTSASGSWRQQYFGSTANSGQAADEANPAGDGITNFFKRAFGLSPLVAATNPAAIWPQSSLDKNAGTLGLNYTRASAVSVPDLTFQVLWSHDLQSWSNSGVSDGITSTDAGAGTETHAATVPLSLGSPIFLKLQVTRN